MPPTPETRGTRQTRRSGKRFSLINLLKQIALPNPARRRAGPYFPFSGRLEQNRIGADHTAAADVQDPLLTEHLGAGRKDDIILDDNAFESRLFHRAVDICSAERNTRVDFHSIANLGTRMDNHPHPAMRQLKFPSNGHAARDLDAQQFKGIVCQASKEGPAARINQGGR